MRRTEHLKTKENQVSIQRFRTKLPDLKGLNLEEFFEKHNVIGLDEGDGELACNMACYEGKKLVAKPLSFSKTSLVTHVPNILAFGKDGKALLVGAEQIGTSRKIYYNFKRCPGVYADMKYPYGDEEKTCAELMGHSFACAVKQLIDCNMCFDPKKPTLLMVGRPSSKGWENAEQDYKKILGRYLPDYLSEDAKNITILVLAESLAAMAGALEMNQENWLNSFIQILDLGSSTFDITTITPDGLPQAGEDSFQFGGNQLDKSIAAYGDYLYYKSYPREEGYTMAADHGKTANLRLKKELYYGDNGSNLTITQGQNAYIYSVYQNGEQVINEDTEDVETLSFRVTKNSMQRILTNRDKNGNELELDCLYCRTERLTGNALHNMEKTHNSWLDACEYVMHQFYERTQALYTKDMQNKQIPRRLILTGGVSNMPEVREMAEKIFGIAKAEKADNPSQTVSKGLALILGNEIIKKYVLEEVKKELLNENGIMPNSASLCEELVMAATNSDLDYYEKVISKWAESAGERTLKACIDCMADPNNGIFNPDDNIVEQACINWFQKNRIDEKIENILHKKFNEMFPKFTEKFACSITMPDMSNMPEKILQNPFKINIYMFFNENNCPDNPYDVNKLFTQPERKKILEVFRSHRQGLSAGTSIDYHNGYSVTIEHCSGLREGIEWEGNRAIVQSIKSIYAAQLIVKDDAAPIRKLVLEKLYPQINEFVENLTYYLAISVHK